MISSTQKVFFAGGDIGEFIERFNQTHDAITQALSHFHAVLNALESLPCPSLCVLTGAALGGGVELALACDFRIGLPTIKIGLPEVSLGIMPGTGGTVRLPRLIGANSAADWICQGDIRCGEQAYQAGLIDRLFSDNDHAITIALEVLQELTQAPETWQQLRHKKQRDYTNLSKDQQQALHDKIIKAQHGSSQTARLTALETINHSSQLDFEQALNTEIQTVASLGKSEASQQLVQAFLNPGN